MKLISMLGSQRICNLHLGGRKHYTTQNVLAVVDFNLKFTYVLAGWEGLAHDALILADALERDDGLIVPQGTC
jgi:hypothetical protein